MKGERRLALVPPAERAGAPGEPGITDEEIRDASALAGALERGEDALALALRAAVVPADLDDADHDALLARALGDADAPPTKAELREAARLRDALDEGALEGDAAVLAGALAAAYRPRPLTDLQNRALITRALGAPRREQRRRALPVTMAALSTLAAVAAGVALLLGRAAPPGASSPGSAPASVARVELIPARSTVALFEPEKPFPREGGETSRIDRIAAARSAELRANRYAAWGVR